MDFPPMSYAMLSPAGIPVIQAVPSPAGPGESRIPLALLADWTKLTDAEKQDCQANFEKRVLTTTTPSVSGCPTQTAPRSTRGTTLLTHWHRQLHFPDNMYIFLSFVQTFLVDILQNATVLSEFVGLAGLSGATITLISRSAMLALPKNQLKAWLPDALHFQRAIQNVRVRDVEVEMPLAAWDPATPPVPSSDNDLIDYTPV
ncbi:hypothetical protein MN608_11355 [Microdochium nivale]|nr:hypothetical protein MN608_11355 [Microdochium nivale]